MARLPRFDKVAPLKGERQTRKYVEIYKHTSSKGKVAARKTQQNKVMQYMPKDVAAVQ